MLLRRRRVALLLLLVHRRGVLLDCALCSVEEVDGALEVRFLRRLHLRLVRSSLLDELGGEQRCALCHRVVAEHCRVRRRRGDGRDRERREAAIGGRGSGELLEVTEAAEPLRRGGYFYCTRTRARRWDGRDRRARAARRRAPVAAAVLVRPRVVAAAAEDVAISGDALAPCELDCFLQLLLRCCHRDAVLLAQRR